MDTMWQFKKTPLISRIDLDSALSDLPIINYPLSIAIASLPPFLPLIPLPISPQKAIVEGMIGRGISFPPPYFPPNWMISPPAMMTAKPSQVDGGTCSCKINRPHRTLASAKKAT